VRVAIALQEPVRLLQHLFYFIAHETTPLSRAFSWNALFGCIFTYCEKLTKGNKLTGRDLEIETQATGSNTTGEDGDSRPRWSLLEKSDLCMVFVNGI